MVFELRRLGDRREAVGGEPAEVCGLLLARPALAAMLLDGQYPDGSVRRTSTLLVFVHEGRLKGCLRDRDTDMTAWVAAGGLEGILDALEAGLQGDKLDWRKEGKRKR